MDKIKLVESILKEIHEDKQKKHEIQVANVDSIEKLEQFKNLLLEEYNKNKDNIKLDYFETLNKTRGMKSIHFLAKECDGMTDDYEAYNVDDKFIACVGWSLHVDQKIDYYEIGKWPSLKE